MRIILTSRTKVTINELTINKERNNFTIKTFIIVKISKEMNKLTFTNDEIDSVLLLKELMAFDPANVFDVHKKFFVVFLVASEPDAPAETPHPPKPPEPETSQRPPAGLLSRSGGILSWAGFGRSCVLHRSERA